MQILRPIARVLDLEEQGAALDLLPLAGEVDLRHDAAHLRRDDDPRARHDEAGQVEQHVARRLAGERVRLDLGEVLRRQASVNGPAGDGVDEEDEQPLPASGATGAASAVLRVGDLEGPQSGRDRCRGRSGCGRLARVCLVVQHRSYLSEGVMEFGSGLTFRITSRS